MSPTFQRYRQGAASLVVNRAWCKGCRICVRDCPIGILALDQRSVVVVTEIGRCVFCGICAVRCPDFAIHLERSLPGEEAPAAAAAGAPSCA